MMDPQLDKYLFRENTYTYAVLDGASVPDLPVRLYEMQPPNVCLYRGELPADLIYVAPYLVHLLPGAEFTNWLLAECWGRHWGIFAQSPSSLVGVRKHFRSLLIVNDETGNPLLFRFYDPRAFLSFLPTCNQEELSTFFGDINYYFAESNDAAILHRYQFSKNELKKTNLSLKSEDGLNQ
jgi:Domain of unknown function (DUF4123)